MHHLQYRQCSSGIRPITPTIVVAAAANEVARGRVRRDAHPGVVRRQQRIRIIAIHNSDVSDGWEREGENPNISTRFRKVSYPLGINIIFYLMTH